MAKHFHKAGLITRLASLLAVCLFSSMSLADMPGSFTAEYTISDKKPISERSLSFKFNNSHYTMRAETRALGFYAFISPDPIIEQSMGIIKGKQVKPTHYIRDNKNQPKKNLDLSFSWKSNELLSKTRPEDIKYKLSPHTHDMLSETLSLMVNLPGTKAQALDIATRSRPKFYSLQRVGEESIETAAGTFKTIKLKRTRNGKNDRVVYIWCAPKLNNLPVKIEKHKNGKVHTALLKSFKKQEK